MSIQNNILWSGIEYYSLENCIIDCTASAVKIDSAIIGRYRNQIYRIEYMLRLNKNWETTSCLVISQCDNEIKKIKLSKNKEGWFLNGEIQPRLSDCTDIDIPLTPLTNSLPINRLSLNVGQEQIVDVIYIDILEHTLTPLKQKYRRLSDDVYKYENVPNDFEAEITVDHQGFVIDYPQLFERKAISKSNFTSNVTPRL